MAKLLSLAVLIDGDNIAPNLISGLVKRVAEIGTPGVQRVYRDWSRQPDWKDVMLKYALQPMHQFNYAPGKNATDIAMVIDALDLAQTGQYDGFCLASSDSDFAPLAIRLRQRGLKVYGLGESKTPLAFQKACDGFSTLTNANKVAKKA